MGLFERLRGLLGGAAPESDAEPADTRRTASPPTEPRSARPPRDAAPRDEGHGRHWDAVLPPARRDRGVERVVDAALAEGETLDGNAVAGVEVTGHRHAEGPFGVLAVREGGETVTAYPVGEGVDHEVTLDAREEWGTELEAWVGGTLAGEPLTLFPTNYFRHSPATFAGTATVSLSLFMYDLAPAEYETVVDEDGEEVDVAGIAGYRPHESGAPDEVVLRTTVTAVEEVGHRDLAAYRVRAPLFRTDDGDDVEVAIYAGAHVVETPPEVGQDVEGAGWVQGWVE